MKLRSLLLAVIGVLLMSTPALAGCQGPGGGSHSPLSCRGGVPVAGTQLLNEGNACQCTGLDYMFSTVMCQFVSMVNVIMGKFYCAIQMAVTPIIGALIVLFVVISGIQFLSASAQFNSKEIVVRVLKLSIVYWMVSDPGRGVASGVGMMYDFFIAFIADTTSWVVQILDQVAGNHITGGNPTDVGTTSTFRFIDELIFKSFTSNNAPALTGLTADENAKVIGFFISLCVANPSLLGWILSFLASVFLVFLRTLIAFLIAVIGISFLMGLSPIFISFMLFQVTYQYFDMWLRFMISYCLQVMVTFAILALYIYSLTLFSPFFKNLAEIIFPYKNTVSVGPSLWKSADTYGICPLGDLQFVGGKVVVHCANPNFNPGPFYLWGQEFWGDDAKEVIPPTALQKMAGVIFFMFYNMISLVLISFGFHTLQKNTGSIARQLAGPAFVPTINGRGLGNNTFKSLKNTGGEAKNFMGGGAGFNRRHESAGTSDTVMSRTGVGSYIDQIKDHLSGRRS